MATTSAPCMTSTQVADTRPRVGRNSLPPPPRLTSVQLRDLEFELRRELAALDRRLTNERADESAEAPRYTIPDAAAASHRASDIIARRDAVTRALVRLDAGMYGSCARCGAPIPFGRLLAMPEVTYCLSCNGTA